MLSNSFIWLIMTALRVAAVVFAVGLAAGFFGRLHPALDSFSHFRVHLAVLLGVTGILVLAGGFRLEGLLAGLMGLAAFASVHGGIVPGLGPVQAAFRPKAEESPVYRLLQMNLRFDNAQPEKVLSLIGRIRPDVVTLQEVSTMWAPKLELLASAYPHRLICRLGNRAGGVAILSLRPFAEDRPAECIDGGTFAVAGVNFGGRTAEIAAIHLHWPWPLDQASQVEGLAAGPLKDLGPTAILAGDFNAVPWSASVRRVAAAGGLTAVPGIGPTWLDRRLPEFLRFAGLPLDQVFAKGGVRVHSATALDAAGSDHLPVLVEFSLDDDGNRKADPAQSATAAADHRSVPRG